MALRAFSWPSGEPSSAGSLAFGASLATTTGSPWSRQGRQSNTPFSRPRTRSMRRSVDRALKSRASSLVLMSSGTLPSRTDHAGLILGNEHGHGPMVIVFLHGGGEAGQHVQQLLGLLAGAAGHLLEPGWLRGRWGAGGEGQGEATQGQPAEAASRYKHRLVSESPAHGIPFPLSGCVCEPPKAICVPFPGLPDAAVRPGNLRQTLLEPTRGAQELDWGAISAGFRTNRQAGPHAYEACAVFA